MPTLAEFINQKGNFNSIDYNLIHGRIFDLGFTKVQISQRFNDKDTDPDTKKYYTTNQVTGAPSGRLGHDGMDFVFIDQKVRAFEDGEVVFADWEAKLPWANKGYYQGLGIMTVVWNREAGRMWVYGHLASNIGVEVGMKIKRGDFVGLMGGSGYGIQRKWDVHTHVGVFEVNSNMSVLNRNNGFWGAIDPLPFLLAESKVEPKASVNSDIKINSQSMPSYDEQFKNDNNILNRLLEIKGYPKDEALKDFPEIHRLVSENHLPGILDWYKDRVRERDHDARRAAELEAQNKELQVENQNLLAEVNTFSETLAKLQREKADLEDQLFSTSTADQTEVRALQSKISGLEAQLKQSTETWSWNKWFVGLSRNASFTAILGILVTLGVGQLTSTVPELAPYKDEIVGWVFSLFGIAVAGQNAVNIVKSSHNPTLSSNKI